MLAARHGFNYRFLPHTGVGQEEIEFSLVSEITSARKLDCFVILSGMSVLRMVCRNIDENAVREVEKALSKVRAEVKYNHIKSSGETPCQNIE